MNSPAACLTLVERITRRFAPKLDQDLRCIALTKPEREKLLASKTIALPAVPTVSPQVRYRYTGEGNTRPPLAAVTTAVNHLLSMDRIPHGYIKKYCTAVGVNYNSVFSRYRGLLLCRKLAQEKAE
jgi:hypothetical protein